ncbi:penicillin-binding transpeptidase domain-containing protein [Legionella maioricensis]|uniref:Beta-lactamase n=1 Tax=Legionella maioricensis TaxID=2896528 RepID=A0A9X2D0Z4_9GAMM|nr:penicillin-binding transpeptidase domain-containing protein [Legionella maioricensis]MCL9684317.1 penicillin binding protein transpeptidase domain-containing protein [Legionella maioricensis]MCL9687183.1 penicillin binding protein transpeptidase domain-containing protein [Legionella maioricensis]
MNKLLALILATTSFSVVAKEITPEKYSQVFKNYDACFILYSVNQQKIVSEYNPENHCNQRIAPDSTFKVPLSLMAFDKGIINQNTVFKWDGKKGLLAEHDRDQTPGTWIKYSVIWVSQQITSQLGYAPIKHYLADFNYGNQDFTGDSGKNNGLHYAWLSSSLKISAVEQLHFLNAMLSNKLPIAKEAIVKTKENMYLGKLDNGADYYGKTGSGRHGRNERESNPSQLRDGWFVGFVEDGSQKYIFVSNLTDKVVQASIDKSDGSLKPFGSQLLKPITMQLLNDYFAK